MPRPLSRWLLPALGPVLLVLGCAFPTEPASMVPLRAIRAQAFARTVNVRTDGGSHTVLWGKSQISNSALKQAVLEALVEAGLMLPLEDRMGDYQLEVVLQEIEQPSWSLVTTVNVRTLWILTPTGGQQPVWSEQIAGSSTATLLDAMIGTRRCRLATEGAAQDVIAEAMRQLSLQNL